MDHNLDNHKIENTMKLLKYAAVSLMILSCVCSGSCKRQEIQEFHVFEINEILLLAEDQYSNPYKDVECWVDLEGPGFNKRIYGFWDGGQQFKVRVTAIKPGEWSWTSGSTSASDRGLNG